MYKYKSGNTLDFGSIPNANKLFDGIKRLKIVSIGTKSQWRLFESNLGKARKGGNRSQEQKEAIVNFHILQHTKRSYSII